MATLTGGIGKGSKWLLDKIVGALAATGVNPNFLTFLGLVVNFIAAATFAVGHFFTGALIIFFAGFLDMLDGQVARRRIALPHSARSTIPLWIATPTWRCTWACWFFTPSAAALHT